MLWTERSPVEKHPLAFRQFSTHVPLLSWEKTFPSNYRRKRQACLGNDKVALSFRECQCNMLIARENLWHKLCTDIVELQIFDQNFLYRVNTNADSFRYILTDIRRSCITNLCTSSMFSSLCALSDAPDLGSSSISAINLLVSSFYPHMALVTFHKLLLGFMKFNTKFDG